MFFFYFTFFHANRLRTTYAGDATENNRTNIIIENMNLIRPVYNVLQSAVDDGAGRVEPTQYQIFFYLQPTNSSDVNLTPKFVL